MPLYEVTAPDGKKYQVKEAAAPIDFDKVLEAIAALYGDYFDDIWETDAMQDLANDLEQAGPTDQELDFIIAKGKLPKRLANIQFSAGDNVRFGEGAAPIDECGPMPTAMPMGELTISGSPEALAVMLKLAGLQAPAMMEQPVEEEKDPRYEANTTPEEEVMPVQVQIKGGNGEVAGMEKAMHKDGAARFSDNPLAMKESIDDMSEMGRDLMKAYESIKIQK